MCLLSLSYDNDTLSNLCGSRYSLALSCLSFTTITTVLFLGCCCCSRSRSISLTAVTVLVLHWLCSHIGRISIEPAFYNSGLETE